MKFKSLVKKKTPPLKKRAESKSVVVAETPKEDEQKEQLSFGEQRLSEVLDKAVDISTRCTDTIVKNPSVSLRTCKVHQENKLMAMYEGADGAHHDAIFTPYALSQFGTKIGVPGNYLERCLKKDRPEIAEYNVSAWLKDYTQPLMIREYRDGDKDTIRGVLSEKYSICDTPDIIDGVDRVLDLGTFSIRGNYVSPERFHLRLAEKTKMNVPNEDLFAGMTIDSSDVGRATLRVNFMVYKQVCSNGLIVGRSSTQLFKQKHIGITAEDFRTNLERGFELYPKIAERVEKQIERTMNKDTPFNFNYESDEELEALVENIRNQTKVLSPAGANSVIEIMQSGRYDDNRWGYINALTEEAQKLTLEKRLQLETYAGSLLAA